MSILKKIVVAFIALVLIIVPIQDINAASFSVSAPGSATPGQRVWVGVNFSGEGKFTISASNGSGGGTFWYPGDGSGAYITVGSSGSTTVTVTAVDAVTAGEVEISGSSVNKTIAINTPPAPKVETPAEKAAREERERIAREKAEEADKAKKEAEEALEKEKAAKTPLFEGIEIISTSAKRNGKVITTIAPEFNVFEYAYKLPSNIDSIKLNVLLAEGSDTTLAYDLEHEISGTKDIDINAVLGDVTQDFKLSISTNDEELLKRDDGYVYSDEMLDEAMTDLGFTVEELEVDGVKSNMFVMNNLSLQLVVDEDNEAEFYRLNEDNSVIDRGQIIIDDSEVYFVSSIVPEEFQDYKLHGNSLNSTEIVAPEFLSEVDESLSLKQNIRGWALDDGVLLYASDSNDTVEFVSFTADEGIKSAIVAFDKVDNTLLYAFYAVSGALLVTIVAFGYYVFLQRKKSTNIDTY